MYYFAHPKFIEKNIPDFDKDLLKLISTLSIDFNSAIVDRTGHINTCCDILSPIPQRTNTKTFEEIVNDRAKEIVNYVIENRLELRLKWNAVDLPIVNTCMIVAIAEHIKTLPSPKRPMLRFIYDENEEYQWLSFFENYILENKTIFKGVQKNYKKHTGNLNHLVVYGNHGRLLSPQPYFAYADHLKSVMFNDVCDNWVWSYIKPIVNKMPNSLGDKTVPAVMTWLDFVLSWQWNSFRSWIKVPRPDIDQKHNMSFYDTEAFQNWFLNSSLEDMNPGLSPTTTAWPCREYIRKYFNDSVLDQEEGFLSEEYLEKINTSKLSQKDDSPLIRTGVHGTYETFAIDTKFTRYTI